MLHDVTCVVTNVDHVAKVAVGVVVVVALLFLLVVGEALAPKHPFLVKQATTLVEVFCCVLHFQLNSDCYCWRRCWQILLGVWVSVTMVGVVSMLSERYSS